MCKALVPCPDNTKGCFSIFILCFKKHTQVFYWKVSIMTLIRITPVILQRLSGKVSLFTFFLHSRTSFPPQFTYLTLDEQRCQNWSQWNIVLFLDSKSGFWRVQLSIIHRASPVRKPDDTGKRGHLHGIKQTPSSWPMHCYVKVYVSPYWASVIIPKSSTLRGARGSHTNNGALVEVPNAGKILIPQ